MSWTEINDLFHRAIDQPRADRGLFLERACADAEIRAEVLSLLDAHDRAAAFIELPAVPAAIGHYRVIRLLGEGGMGVVFLAHDTRLDRTVAIKALPPRFLADPVRRERLRREARAAASLNHPNIATIYALEDIDGQLYIVSEYVPGETLRDVLHAQGAMPVLDVVDVSLALARGLDAAHVEGIVHRDLKPENVMRTPSGTIKILDFGLARMVDASRRDASLSAEAGVLGTPAYMSPEQIRGDEVDGRADVFALGVIMREALSGAHPFAGADAPAIIANILQTEPPPLRASAPAVRPLLAVMEQCLNKARDARPVAADVVRMLTEVRTHLPASGTLVVSPASSHTIRAVSRSASWWWQFHQASAALFYLLLLDPLWRVRHVVIEPRTGTLVFVLGLVGAVIASAIRLHLWFAIRLDPTQAPSDHRRATRWRQAGDLAFASALAVAGMAALGVQSEWGVILVAAAAAVLVSFVVIEPTTTRTAFARTSVEEP